MSNSLKIVISIISMVIILPLLSYFLKIPSALYSIKSSNQANSSSGQQGSSASSTNKLCEWVDNSDIIIKVIIPEGVEKDTSYEAGFYFNAITSSMRVARQACDYRTGFSYTEMAGKGAVQVGVRGYTDSNRRQLVGEPISLVFGPDGKPSIGSYIEVTLVN